MRLKIVTLALAGTSFAALALPAAAQDVGATPAGQEAQVTAASAPAASVQDNAATPAGSGQDSLAAQQPAATGQDRPAPSSQATDAGQSSGLGDIVVTARRRSESLQSVPVSVAVVNQAELNSRGNVTVQDLVQIVPGLQVSAGNNRSDADVTIRGQSRSPTTLAPAVITYFNEVALPKIAEGAFFDLANIQVLKGPQGTLFGRVTDGGAVLLAPEQPSGEFGGYVEGALGDYGLKRLQAAVTIPIVGDAVSLRLAGSLNRRDGYTYNLFNNTKMDNVHTDDFRASLLLKPFIGFENLTIFQYGQSNEDCCGSVVTGVNPSVLSGAYLTTMQNILAAQQARGPYIVNEGVPNFYRNGMYYTRNAKYLVNTTKLEVTDGLTIRNIFGFSYNKETTGTVLDGNTAATGGAIGVPGIPIPGNSRRQVSDELQLQGSLFDKRLTYTIGGYLEHQTTPGPTDSYIVQGAGAIQVSIVQYPRTTSRAVYGQVTYDLRDLLPGLKFDAGLRYTSDKADSRQAEYILIGAYPPLSSQIPTNGQCLSAAQLAVQFPNTIPKPACADYHTSSDATTYTLGLNYQIDSKRFIYATIRSGYRPGGINFAAGGSVGLTYGPEFATSRELGIKADWNIGGAKLRTNLTGFIDTTRELQQLVTSLAGTPTSGVVNGGTQIIKGLEFESELVPFQGLTLNFDWTHSLGRFRTSLFSSADIAAACPADPYVTAPAPNGIVCPLRQVNSLPKDVVSVAAHIRIPIDPALGKLTIGGNYYYTAKNSPGYVNTRHYATSFAPLGGFIPAYSLVNLEVSWENVGSLPVDLRLFVNNVTNKAYIQTISDYLDKGSLGIQAAYYGPPRMFGASIRYRFGK